jgi:hypothetical protein
MTSKCAWRGVVQEYRDLLPVPDDAAVISL